MNKIFEGLIKIFSSHRCPFTAYMLLEVVKSDKSETLDRVLKTLYEAGFLEKIELDNTKIICYRRSSKLSMNDFIVKSQYINNYSKDNTATITRREKIII